MTTKLSADQIQKLEEFEEWFSHWPYSPYEDLERRALVEELRKIFPRSK